MNGESFPCGKYAGSLRKHLFKEHLGILGHESQAYYYDINDPTTESFYKDVWHRIAVDNTEFYEKVFHCIPSDKVENFAALKKNQEQLPLWHTEFSRASVMLDSIEVSFKLTIIIINNNNRKRFRGTWCYSPSTFWLRRLLRPAAVRWKGWCRLVSGLDIVFFQYF